MIFLEMFIASIVVFSGYFVLGLTGFGGGLIVISLLLLFLDIKYVVPAQTLLNVILFSFSVYRSRRSVQASFVYPVFSGSFIAVLLGTYMLAAYQSVLLKKVMGVLVILFALKSLLERGEVRSLRPNRIVGFITGVVSGLLSALFGAGGPVAVIYFNYGLRGKERVRATLLFYFLLLQIWVFITYVYAGLIGPGVLRLGALILPSSTIGMILGSKVQASISEATFKRAVAITLLITGALLTVS